MAIGTSSPPVPFPLSHPRLCCSYFARVGTVWPPTSVREAVDDYRRHQIIPATYPPDFFAHDQMPGYDSYCHRLGTNLDLDPVDVATLDDPAEYDYRIQLMDEDGKFEGSFLEAKAKSLTCALALVCGTFTNSASTVVIV